MKTGIIINTNDPETVWNAFRDEKFNVQEQIGLFAEHKGQIFALVNKVKTDER